MVDKGLYGYQIGHAMHGIVDLYAADEVSNLTPPVIAICNTGVSGTEGEHWVVICIDRHGYGELFDSFGMHPIVYGFITILGYKAPLLQRVVIMLLDTQC